MDKSKIIEIAQKRKRLWDETQDEYDYGIQQVCDELTNLIVSDLPGAIKFMCEDPDCDDEIFADWSEVFDDVVRKTQSKEFLEALKVAAKRFPEACAKYSIAYSIECAEDELLD